MEHLINQLIKIIFSEFIKKYGDTDLSKKLLNFTDKTLRNYLEKKAKKIRLVKTLMHYETPVEFVNIYQPLKLLYKRKIFEFDKIDDIFIDSNYISIIGEAGSGKTMFTKNLFLECIKNKYKIPIILSFRNLGSNSDLATAIKKEIRADDSDVEYIRQCLERGKFLIIFDGFDERHEKQFTGHQDDIYDCLYVYTENKFIVTSRPYSGAERLPLFHNYKIKALSLTEQYQFVSRQLSAKVNNVDFEDQDNEIKSITNSIKTQRYMFMSDFLKNPLLLLLYIITFKYTNTIPLQKHIFFRRVFNTLFLMHDSLSKVNFKRTLFSNIQQVEFENIVQKFAFISYADSVYNFKKNYFYSTMRNIKDSVEFDFDPSCLLRDLLINIPLLNKDAEIFSFVHSSIQEYLCVKFISDLPDDETTSYAYDTIRKNFSKRYFYQFNNFAQLCYEMDRINYLNYFYIPSLKSIRKAIFDNFEKNDFSKNDSKTMFLIAKYFLENIFSAFIINEDRNNYISMNNKYASSIFILTSKFSLYNKIIDSIYRFIRSGPFYINYNKIYNPSKSDCIKIIINKRKDIVLKINQLITQTTQEIHDTVKIIQAESESNKLLIEKVLKTEQSH